MFIRLLTRIAKVSNHTKYISLNNQQCMNQTTFINLHPKECTRGLRYYPFTVNLDRCVIVILFFFFSIWVLFHEHSLYHFHPLHRHLDISRAINTLVDLSYRVCLPNKTADLNLNFLKIIKGINESNVLTKFISCKCKCKSDGRKCSSNQKWNNDKQRGESKIWKNIMCKKRIYLESCYM